MSAVENYIDQTVQVILYDGRVIVGKLRGFDIRTNLILSDCVEREFSEDQGVEMTPLGLYMIKGDNVALVGEVDDEKDSALDWSEIKATPLPELQI